MKEFIVKRRKNYVQRTCRIEEDLLDKIESIVLEYNDILKVNTTIENASISYNINNGILKIQNEISNFEINIAFTNSIVTDEHYTILEIYLDNREKVTIKLK